MNKFFYLILIILTIAAILVDIFRKKYASEDIEEIEEEKYPFNKKEFLLNIPERKFFEALLQKIPTNYVAYPQIVLSNIIYYSGDKSFFLQWQTKINKKTLDFVIFEKEYLKPVLAIEYDGHTHNREDRIERDDFVNKVLTQVGIKVVHIKHSQSLDLDSIINTEILSNLQ